MANETELLQVVSGAGLEKKISDSILEKLAPFYNQASEWKKKADELVVTSADQKEDMKAARIARLELKKLRVEANKTRESLKKDSLRYGQTVQAVFNIIKNLIEPIEEHLQKQEDFVKIQEQIRIESLTALRMPEVEELQEFIPYGLDLGRMSEEDYSKLIQGAKLQQSQKEEAERKAEEERLAAIKAEQEEQKRIKAENERLRKEAEQREKDAAIEREKQEKIQAEREAELKKERQAQEAKLLAEQQERERIQKELRAKEEAERKAKEERAALLAKEEKAKKAAERKARLAPDKTKLEEVAKMIDSISLPELKNKEGESIINNVRSLLDKVSKYTREQAENL